MIELLVVVGIIALLIAILLPSLSRSRKLAQAAVCASNLHQLGLANTAYAQSNKDALVLAARDIWYPNLERWHGKRNSDDQAFDPRRSDMTREFGRDGRVKECPGFMAGRDYSDTPGMSDGFEAGCGGYGYNASYVGARTDVYGIGDVAMAHSARTAEIRRAAATVMFTDTAFLSGSSDQVRRIAYSFCEPPLWQLDPGPPSSMHPDPTIDFRHLERTNVCWADIHVDGQRMSFSVDYITHSEVTGEQAKAQGIGWFGPRDNTLFDLK